MCPQGGRLGGNPAISCGGVLLGLFIYFFFFFPIPALPVSFGGSRSREAHLRWVGVLRLLLRGSYPVWPLLGREMPLEDGDPVRQRGQRVNGEVSGTPRLGETGDPPLRGTPAPDGSGTEAMAEGRDPGPALGDRDVSPGGAPQQAGQREEALMTELSELVQKVVKSSSWWERHGVDIGILACSFLLLPAGNPT